MNSPAVTMSKVLHTMKVVITGYHYLHKQATSVKEIYSVGTINNVETSYFTQLKYVT